LIRLLFIKLSKKHRLVRVAWFGHNWLQVQPQPGDLAMPDKRTNRPLKEKAMSVVLGWETSVAMDSLSLKARMNLNRAEIKASLLGLGVLLILFLISCQLAANPIENTRSISALALTGGTWLDPGQWRIIWTVVGLAIIFEFLDAAAGMGYGTAFTPLLLMMGYEPLQIIPVIMIQQACAGLIGAYIHKQYGNVEWRFRPPSETVKLLLIIAGIGALAVSFSISSIYGVLKLGEVWIKLYVVILLLMMGLTALCRSNKATLYRPKRMYFFGALAGFNKGIGGGGYGPVVTIGGLLSGVPAKTMMAVTAFSEGLVCVVSILVWFYWLNHGVQIDFILLPSMLLGSILSVIAAPYATRVLPERAWRTLVPIYCCIIAIVSFWKLVPKLSTLWF
jgi:uncharacterized membrane protein YfcA